MNGLHNLEFHLVIIIRICSAKYIQHRTFAFNDILFSGPDLAEKHEKLTKLDWKGPPGLSNRVWPFFLSFDNTFLFITRLHEWQAVDPSFCISGIKTI